jgi:hypothetical protein
MKKLLYGLLAAVGLAFLLHPAGLAQTVNCSGSFTPNFNCLIPGTWNFAPTNNRQTYDIPFQANGSDATGVVSKVVDLTNAQVLLLGTTPVTLIAAPGIGKSIDVVSVTLIFNRTGGYTNPQNVRLFYGSRSAGGPASASFTGSGFFDASASIARHVAGTPDNTDVSITNQALVIQTATTAAQMTGGNAANSVRVVVNYRIVYTNLST